MLKLGKFNKSAKELLENSYKNIYARDEKGRTVLHYAVDAKTVELLYQFPLYKQRIDNNGKKAILK